MPADEAFDRELTERARAREQAIAEQQAAQAEDDALRRRQQEARRRDAEADWDASRDLRRWAARRLAEANAEAMQFVLRQHLATKRKLFGKEESYWVIDAADGWLIEDGEIDPYEARDAINGGKGPVIWESTYLLRDSNIVITYVDAARYKDDVKLRYHDPGKGMPSPALIPREIQIVRDASELLGFVTKDPEYRIPSKEYFLSAVEKASAAPG